MDRTKRRAQQWRRPCTLVPIIHNHKDLVHHRGRERTPSRCETTTVDTVHQFVRHWHTEHSATSLPSDAYSTYWLGRISEKVGVHQHFRVKKS